VFCFCVPAPAANTLVTFADNAARHDAESKNSEYLIKNTYFARDHSFMAVNTSALTQDDSLAIPLFGGDSLTVDFISRSESVGYMRWVGFVPEIKNMVLTEGQKAGYDAGTLNTMAEQLSEVRITLATLDVKRNEDGTTTYTPIWERPFGLSPEAPAVVERGDRPETVKVVRFDFHDLRTNKRYSMEPLPNSPSVHLLIERDPEKNFAVIDKHASAHLSDSRRAEFARRKQAYKTHLEDSGLGTSDNGGFDEAVAYLVEQGLKVTESKHPELYQKLKDAGYDPENLAAGKVPKTKE